MLTKSTGISVLKYFDINRISINLRLRYSVLSISTKKSKYHAKLSKKQMGISIGHKNIVFCNTN